MVNYTSRPFAYNPSGTSISGTTLYGNLSVGNVSVEYSANYGGLTWWMGPDELSGYFIAYIQPSNDHPTEIIGTTASIGFLGPKAFTIQDFINLANSIPARNGLTPFTNDMDAYNWVMNNGYWTNYLSVTPTPNAGTTPTPTPTPTLTPTNTSTNTPTPTNTVTPTNTITPTTSQAGATPTPTNTSTVTPTNTSTPTNTVTTTNTNTPTPSVTTTATNTPTPTPTSTPTNAAAFSVTISEVGSDVVMTATGALNINGLTLVQSNTGPYGGGGLGVSTATYLMGTINVNFDLYSGFTTNPTSFGSGGGGGGASSTSGDVFGVITPGAPPYELVVPVGYTSGTQITSTQTFANQTLSSLGFTNGTYSYTWPGGSFDVIVGAPSVTPTPTASSVTPTPTPTNGGSGGWLFYSPDNQSVMGPPSSNGNATFITGPYGVYSPNYTGGTLQMYFNLNDSTGTSYSTQFNSLDTSGGNLTISQGSSVAIYSGTSIDYAVIGNYFLLNVTRSAQMIQSASTRFVSGSSINLTFNNAPGTTPTPTPTPSSTSVTPTPTPTVTPTNTITPSNTATNTPTPSVTATITPTNTVTPTITPSATSMPTTIMVAAGSSSTSPTSYSYDGGNTWTASSNSNTFITQPGLAVATDGNIFVLGGTPGGGNSNSLLWSTDGNIWSGSTNGSSMFTVRVSGIAYGGGKWVAVGISSGAAKLAYSTDGKTWSGATNSSIFGSAPTGVAYSGTRWVATAQAGGGANPKTTIAYSDDGITWTATANSTSIFTTTAYGVAWGGGKFVAVGQGTNTIAYSTDGITWSGSTNGNSVISTLGYNVAYNGSQWVAAGQGTNTLAYSSNGTTWSGSTNGNSTISSTALCVAWSGTQWVAGGQSPNRMATSSDGMTWTGSTSGNSVMNIRVQALAAKY
jgi:hypothetical protein